MTANSASVPAATVPLKPTATSPTQELKTPAARRAPGSNRTEYNLQHCKNLSPEKKKQKIKNWNAKQAERTAAAAGPEADLKAIQALEERRKKGREGQHRYDEKFRQLRNLMTASAPGTVDPKVIQAVEARRKMEREKKQRYREKKRVAAALIALKKAT